MKKTAFILIMLLNSVFTFGGEYVVVAGKSSPLSEVSTVDLKRLYTGRMSTIDGNKVVPVNLSLKNAAAIAFLKAVVGKSTTDYKSFWLAEQVRGGSSAPGVQKSSDAMIEFLKDNPDAIGYVEEGKATEEVKVLTVK